MRMRSSLGLALAGAVGVLASCSSQQPTAPQWACGSDAVPYGERVECTVDTAEKRLPEILRWLHERAVLVRDCQVTEPELEEVFVELAR